MRSKQSHTIADTARRQVDRRSLGEAVGINAEEPDWRTDFTPFVKDTPSGAYWSTSPPSTSS